MNLNLTKPIAFFDLETTGLNIASDRIVEISIIKIMPNGDKEIKTKLINPTIPISKESSEIHGIKDADVKNKATFKDVAQELSDFIEGCDLSGYNSNKFDIPLIAEEFLRADINFDVTERNLIDVQNIFHKMEQRTLVAAYRFYCDGDLTNAHSAEADTKATYEILEAQIQKYDELENNIEFLAEFSQRTKNVDLMGRIVYNEKNIPVYNFGKHKGKSIKEVYNKEPGYSGWMLNGDFPLYTKKVLSELVGEIKAEKMKTKKVNAVKAEKNFENKLDQLQNKFKK